MSEIKCTNCDKTLSAEAYLSSRLHAERMNIQEKGVCFDCERKAVAAAQKSARLAKYKDANISLTGAGLQETAKKHIGRSVRVTGLGKKKIIASFPIVYTKTVHRQLISVPAKIRVTRGEKVTIVGVEPDNFFTVRKANGSTVSLPRMNLELTK